MMHFKWICGLCHKHWMDQSEAKGLGLTLHAAHESQTVPKLFHTMINLPAQQIAEQLALQQPLLFASAVPVRTGDWPQSPIQHARLIDILQI